MSETLVPVRLHSLDPVRALVLRRLRRWRHGHLTLRLPEGGIVTLGDPAAPERAHASVHDDAFFARVLLGGEVGAGEAYQDGLWDADDLPLLLRLFVRNLDALEFDSPLARLGQLAGLVAHRLRRNTRAGSARNVHAHYDLGNDFYRLWLDESMAYSCALWQDGDSLERAQQRKVEALARKLELRAGDRLLEIGTGWGGFARHAVGLGCRVTTITLSREQQRHAAALGLDARLCDYRDAGALGLFDKLVSIEMFEQVGAAYFGDFFAACARALRPGGRMVMQTIAMPDQRWARYRRNVDWTQKHIFPGSCIPAPAVMLGAMAASSDLVLRGLEDIGPHYAPTLREWRRRFRARAAELRALGFDLRFLRTWELYLAFSEATFAERRLQDLQLVLARMA